MSTIKPWQEREFKKDGYVIMVTAAQLNAMQAEITDLRNVMSDKDMELANLQRRLRVTETNLDSVTNLLEKANGEIVVLRSENEWLLEAQNTCGSGAGCLHKEAKIDELMAENERLRAELQITTAERDIFKNAADRAISENERLRQVLEHICKWMDRYTTPGHPITNVARAALGKS